MTAFLEQQFAQPKIWISEICIFLEVLISKVDMKWDEGVILPALINMKLT